MWIELNHKRGETHTQLLLGTARFWTHELVTSANATQKPLQGVAVIRI